MSQLVAPGLIILNHMNQTFPQEHLEHLFSRVLWPLNALDNFRQRASAETRSPVSLSRLAVFAAAF